MVLAELIPAAAVDEHGFRAWDDMGVEVEVAEFLYGLVRMLKPGDVVEAGTGSGYAAVAIASALEANGSGWLTTFEPMPEYQARAEARLAGLPAAVVLGQSCDAPELDADLVFIDSLGTVRQRDLDHWLPTGIPVVVHDAKDYDLPGDGLHFDTPRGLWVRL